MSRDVYATEKCAAGKCGPVKHAGLQKTQDWKDRYEGVGKNADLSTMISLCANMCTNGTFIKKTRQNDVVFLSFIIVTEKNTKHMNDVRISIDVIKLN